MIGFILMMLVLMIGIIALVYTQVKNKKIDGSDMWLILFCCVAMLMVVNFKTVYQANPIIIPNSKIQIMNADDIVIIRYKEKNHEYTDIKSYKAIIKGSFTFIETKCYNIFGSYVESEYEIKLK